MKRNMLAPLIAICVILLGLSVGSFFFTPDRAFSENENRYLQTTPELTADNVLSGKFMTEVENYTSDQILLRDFWTGARSALQRLEGRQARPGLGTLLRSRRKWRRTELAILAGDSVPAAGIWIRLTGWVIAGSGAGARGGPRRRPPKHSPVTSIVVSHHERRKKGFL